MNRLALFLIFICISLPAYLSAQTNPAIQPLPFSFSNYSGSTLPASIAAHRFGTTAATIPTTRTTTPGASDIDHATSSTAGGWREEGASGISLLASGTNAAGALVVSINTTGKSDIKVQWTIRTILQQASRDNSIALQYRVGSTGNFTDAGTASTYSSTGKANGDFASFSENLPAAANNQPEVQVRWIYWESSSVSNSRDRLAIDDISIIALSCDAPSNQPTGLTLTPGIVNINGSFTPAAAGSVPASAYLVVMSTSADLGAVPASSTSYAIDDAVGNGTVVSNSNATSFALSGLSPATRYHFFVFAYDAAQSCYKTTAPLNDSVNTLSPAVCTPPSAGATALSAPSITGTSIDLNYTRGNGTNILILANANNPVDSTPINGVDYPQGANVGTGNTVIYNGTASSFSYTGLTQNRTYYFALYEYNNGAYCYTGTPLTGSFTTSCTSPIEVSSFNAAGGNTQAILNWTNPSGACFTETIIVVSNAPINNSGSTYTGPANPVYAGSGAQVAYRGTGSTVTITGLTNGVNYYFKAFTRIGSNYSAGVALTAVPVDPSSGLLYLAGNLHAHSSYSDGNKDNTSLTPKDDYEFARDALCMDFLGISEHNHADAGMHLVDYAQGYNQANLVNGIAGGTNGNSIVTFWGMEWGVISGGGHTLVYGFDDQLIGWETGNYNIYCPKSDYNTLFDLVNNKPGAFATLAHPNNSDYGNLITTLKPNADNAIVGTAIESGPAFSTNISYTDYPSSLDFLSYYKNLLAKGYHLGAQMDGDNHNLTFGRTSPNRMIILSAARTRAEIANSIRQMRFYASQDCNARIDYKLNGSLMGSSVTGTALPSITLTVTDPDVEAVSTIQLWGGAIGSAVPSSPIKTYNGVSNVTFTAADVQNSQATGTSYYYYFIITQADGNKIVSSPIWYNRQSSALPVVLIDFNAVYINASKAVQLNWVTAQEQNSRYFITQRSLDNGKTYTDIGTVEAAYNSTARRSYSYADMAPGEGLILYRLKMIHTDGLATYSKTVPVQIGQQTVTSYTIFPNPATTTVYISSDKAKETPAAAWITDIDGRVMASVKGAVSQRQPIEINTSGLPKGIYFIRIIDETGSQVKAEKLVVW